MAGARSVGWGVAGVACIAAACAVDERQVEASGNDQSVQFSTPSASNLGAMASGSLEPGAATPGACASGTHLCGDECVSNDSAATCGSACEPCPTPTGGFATCDGELCGEQCPFGSKVCGGACIALLSGCVGACPEGSHDCDGTCVPDASVDTCGLRCAPCAPPDGAQALCSNGVCTSACLPGFRDCNGLCLEPTSVRGCGASCSVCPVFANATTTCDGTSCNVQCDAANVFLDETGCHPAATQVAASSISQGHGCAVLFDGTMRCWGNNNSGQLGIGSAESSRRQPVVPEIDGVSAIGLGQDFTCALRSDGSVWCWGENSAGQLGRGNTEVTEAALAPLPVVGINDALELSVGAFHSCVRRPSGLYCWGSNSFGELGPGLSARIVSQPAQVNIEAVNQVSTGRGST
ncbi:MAG TPA: hypothetical protein VJU61_00765, partial [Polyangiaceae bacterium]|nr:hypothetical protein [Polyangiaceae bacterium]